MGYKEVRPTHIRMITIVPYEEAEMRVYDFEDLDKFINSFYDMQDPKMGEFVIDVEVVHWDKEPNGQMRK